MDVTTTFEKETSNYAVYACPEMDFRMPGVKLRAWIPKKEFEGLPPGVYPPEIVFRIMDNNEKAQEPGADVTYDMDGNIAKVVLPEKEPSILDGLPGLDDDVPF